MAPFAFEQKKMVRYLGATGQGQSGAQFMASDDGIQYVVKFKENSQGIRILTNELVANTIACYLKLPCPQGIIAEIDSGLLEISNIEERYGRQISAGLHFGSLKIENSYRQPPRALINQVRNKDTFPGIILFDILTDNNNRNNQGNYIIQSGEQSGFDFYIIDHGYCFGRPNWDTSIINKIGTWNRNALKEMRDCIQGPDPFRVYIEKVKSLSNEFITEIVDGIPVEWNVSPSEREALKRFLFGQRDKIEEIINQYKNLFPGWN